MNGRLPRALLALSILFLAPSCTPLQQPIATSPSGGPDSVPVTANALTGDWARVLVLNKAPAPETAHYWLRLTPEGAFSLTTNKMEFEAEVTHAGTYSLDGDVLTLSATTGSQKCEGQSATYQVTMYEGRTMALQPISVPCTQWLNMGAGNLGEDTIWLGLGD